MVSTIRLSGNYILYSTVAAIGRGEWGDVKVIFPSIKYWIFYYIYVWRSLSIHLLHSIHLKHLTTKKNDLEASEDNKHVTKKLYGKFMKL